MVTPVIQFNEVGKVYGSQGEVVRLEALIDINFKVEPHEFVAIVGPSGSGKSTLLHLIGLLDRPSTGKIFIDGMDTHKLSENALAKLRNLKIGFVFQQFNLLARTSAQRNVELPLVYRNISPTHRAKMAHAELEKVGLEDKLNNMPSQLSGGQQQRVAIARALVTKPSLLLADEPTGNLDSKSGAEILKLFAELHRAGVTLVMVTHDPEIAKMADRQIDLKDGRIWKS